MDEQLGSNTTDNETQETGPADSAAGAATATPPDEETAAQATTPRKRGGRRAATRPAGPPTPVFSAAADTPAEVAVVEVQVPAAGVVAVFQAPEPEKVAPKPKKKSKPTSDTTEGTSQASAAEEGVGDEEAASGSEAGADEPEEGATGRRRRRRGGRGRGRKSDQGEPAEAAEAADGGAAEAADGGAAAGEEATAPAESEEGKTETEGEGSGSRRRRRRRRRGGGDAEPADAAGSGDEVTAVKGSTRLEAKRQRRREGRAHRGMRAPILSEAEFLARRESVARSMVLRQHHGLTQIAVLEDEVLVEHYVSSATSSSMIGNVYLGRVQNVLPSMEAAFVDIGRGRNAVLYAGEVNWDLAGLEGQPKRIELALKSGDSVLVQVTKDPVGHKGARLTSQISLPGRFLVYVPQGGMTGISRKLPDRERTRLKRILKSVLPEDAGVIVRTAAEGASEEQLRQDVERLAGEWQRISEAAESASAPALLRSEPDLAIKVVRDIFNEDFASMVISGNDAYEEVSEYVSVVAPDMATKVQKWTEKDDIFAVHRIDEQLTKALDRKVWLPSGGSLVIDRTEAMTVVDVNTGKFVGKGGNLEETVTRNNLEAAEEIVRQLRLRDIGGIIVVDFIDMVLESNRELVLRRLVECLSRDRTKHQVAEVTSLGLVQMTRKRIGQGLLETFSTNCETCNGRGVKVQNEPVASNGGGTPKARRPRVTGPIPGAPTKPKQDQAQATPEPDEDDGSEETPETPSEPEAADTSDLTASTAPAEPLEAGAVD